jgi:hypothetical protein
MPATHIILNPVVDAALTHVASALNVSRSSYIEAVLRVKFDIGLGRLAQKDFSKEGLFKHLCDEGFSIPPELKSFRFDPAGPQKKRKPGRMARAGVGNIATHNSGFIGSVSVGDVVAIRSRSAQRKS